MSLLDSSLSKVLLKELRRRKVFQVALVYALMAWGVMQVGELLFEALQVPENAYTLLVILVLLGFPVAVVLAWAYEITPEGVRRDLVRELQRQPVERLALTCPKMNPDSVVARIAILPISDMAPEHGLSHFCEGLAEEIQNSLCSLPGIEVIARAHSFQYGGKKIDIERIRRELAASAIIEGSVRCIDGIYRISVQLVDVSTGTNVWAHSHEVQVGNEFVMQKRVADAVARDTLLTFDQDDAEESRNQQMILELPEPRLQ